VPELTVESGPDIGKRYSFASEVVVGRGDVADIRVDDGTVSRRHAVLRAEASAWQVEDLGSANGTQVNDTPISGRQTLRDGDIIALGQLRMRFRQEIAEPTVRAPTPVTPPPQEGPGGRLFQEMLSRVRLFCDIGELGAQRHNSPDELARKAMSVVLQGFPRLDRVALFVHVPVGDTLSLLAQATRDGRAFQPTSVAPIAREALQHQHGLLLLDRVDRNALTERLRMQELFGACAAMPLRYAGEPIGVLYLDSVKDADALRLADREHLVATAGLIAALIAPLREPKRDFDVERHDLTLARRIQQRFLPQSPPTLTGYQIVDSYAAARVIGGDHYDFVSLADGRHGLVIADVSGKALSGALYMARLGAVLKQAAARTRSAGELLEDVNRVLYNELEAGMFVTMLVAVLETRSGAIEIASAGHPAPLLRRPDGGIDRLEAPNGPPLGAMSDPRYESGRYSLNVGEYVLLFTDGLDEAHNADGGLFGLERVEQVLSQRADARAAIEGLRETLARFVGSEPQSDDLTMVVLQRV
jgi:serine phosphatase RsbU (regulator of sigma subunit)